MALARQLSRREVSELLGVPIGTLARWAYMETGPPYWVAGRHAKYDEADLERWIAERKSNGPRS